jgi:transcriptional regulator
MVDAPVDAQGEDLMTATPFVPREPADVPALVDAYPLCWVVSAGPEGQAATPLPLLAERGPDGGVVELFGHFALSNPQVALLRRQPRAMILAQGPNGYISPRLVSNPTWGPTWNYAVARFDVEIRFVPEENDAALRRLAAFLERDAAQPWTVDRMGARYAELSRYIVAFRATILAEHARFKLGQDETPGTFDEIVAGLGDQALAAWMTRTNSRSRGDL